MQLKLKVCLFFGKGFFGIFLTRGIQKKALNFMKSLLKMDPKERLNIDEA